MLRSTWTGIVVLGTAATLTAQDRDFRLSSPDPWLEDAPSARRTPTPARTAEPRSSAATKAPRAEPEVAKPDSAANWIYRVSPPPGLLRVRDGLPSAVVEAYRSPTREGGAFSVTRFRAAGRLETFLRKTVRDFGQRLDSFRVLRMSRLVGSPERWIVEIEGRHRRRGLRQLQVFSRMGSDVLVLTYSAPAKTWERHEPFYQRSVESLMVERKRPKSDEPAPSNEPEKERKKSGRLRGILDGLLDS